MRIKDKINKKAGGYTLTAVSNTKYYSFVIDGSLNEPSVPLKWYIFSLKLYLKKFILEYDLIDAVVRADEAAYSSYKSNFNEKPIINLGVCRNNHGTLEILTLNDIKCYLKTKNVSVICDNKIVDYESRLFDKANNRKLKFDRSIYHDLSDTKSYIYTSVPYEEPYSILFCNLPFQNYQKYLRLEDEHFNTLVGQQGLKYCYNHLRRIEDKDSDFTEIPRLKRNSDVCSIYKVLI